MKWMVAVLALLLAACGSGGGTSGGSSTTTEAPAVKFAQCMRDNGVDIPDPGPDADKLGGLTGVDRNSPAFKPAMEACKQYLPGGGDLSKMDEKQLERLREFARCMREQGVDMPDPDPNGGKPDLGQVDRNSPAFRTALEACQGKITELVK